MYDEVFQAASERRQPNLAPQLAAIERGASQVAGVAALLGASSVDPRLMPLAAMMLPTPPVVRLVQPRLKALGSALLASVSTVAKVAWKPLPADNPKASAGSVALQSEASLAAGEHFRSAIVAEGLGVKASMDAVMAAHAVLVEACAGEACVQGLQGSGTLLLFPCRAPRLCSNDPPVRLPARPPPPPLPRWQRTWRSVAAPRWWRRCGIVCKMLFWRRRRLGLAMCAPTRSSVARLWAMWRAFPTSSATLSTLPGCPRCPCAWMS